MITIFWLIYYGRLPNTDTERGRFIGMVLLETIIFFALANLK